MQTKDISNQIVCHAVYTQSGLGIPTPCDLLVTMTGAPAKVCLRALERAERQGYIEYGHSIHGAWLTKKGLALLLGIPHDKDTPMSTTYPIGTYIHFTHGEYESFCSIGTFQVLRDINLQALVLDYSTAQRTSDFFPHIFIAEMIALGILTPVPHTTVHLGSYDRMPTFDTLPVNMQLFCQKEPC